MSDCQSGIQLCCYWSKFCSMKFIYEGKVDKAKVERGKARGKAVGLG
jgi:hypothetical protein